MVTRRSTLHRPGEIRAVFVCAKPVGGIGSWHNCMHHSNLAAYIGAVIAIIVIFAVLRNRRR